VGGKPLERLLTSNTKIRCRHERCKACSTE
jgi:hypothetical protein